MNSTDFYFEDQLTGQKYYGDDILSVTIETPDGHFTCAMGNLVLKLTHCPVDNLMLRFVQFFNEYHEFVLSMLPAYVKNTKLSQSIQKSLFDITTIYSQDKEDLP